MDSRFEPTVDQVTVERYVAPCVEAVLTPHDMAREIFYAGGITCGCDDDPWTNIPD